MIEELKKTNKDDIFKPKIKPKLSLIDKIKILFGYGK